MESAVATAKDRILVNDEPQEVPRGSTVEQLIELLELTGKRVAVARNGDVIPRSTYGEVALRDGDRIEILEAVGGG
jgi:sulfur carrier protein